MSRRVIPAIFMVALIAPALLRAADADTLRFEIYQDKGNEFRWRLKQGDETIATAGEGYAQKSSCKNAIDGIKKGLEAGKHQFDIYQDKANAFRWRLKAANGQVVAATNKGYKDKADCEKIIEVIKKGIPTAEVEEKP